MMYYKHIETGEVIGSLNNLRGLVNLDGSRGCITDIVNPNKVIGNGIICECMHYIFLRNNYKRISKAKALEICPDFGQWRHVDDKHNMSVTCLGSRYLQELIPMRKEPFGTPFTEYGKERTAKKLMTAS